MKITKLIFAASFSGLMFCGTLLSTDVLEQYKEPYITHKFEVQKKYCEDTVHEGKEVQKCYLSDGKEWHWTEKPTYNTHKEGDTVKFVKYELDSNVEITLIMIATLSLIGFVITGLSRLEEGEW